MSLSTTSTRCLSAQTMLRQLIASRHAAFKRSFFKQSSFDFWSPMAATATPGLNVNDRILRMPKTGAIRPDARPGPKNGLLKATVCTMAALYLGALIAEGGATFLEEHEIFVPEDDDDD